MTQSEKPVVALGIESSCDETSLALVKEGKLLGHVLASQSDLHALFGGVVPELASREHYRYIGRLYDELMARVGKEKDAITDICVARGPGLLGSLLVGVAFAKALALGLNANLIGVNHLHAHLLAAGLEGELSFPALGLLVSGGHTNLYRIESPSAFIQLGKTLDDAAGEAFDKIGSHLGFPYPAGRLINEAAERGTPSLSFPLPYLQNDNLDFSFSGLKTAVATFCDENLPGISYEKPIRDVSALPKIVLDVCASFNMAIARTLAKKTERALERNRDLSRIILAGGVGANSIIRKEIADLARTRHLELLAPKPTYCTDNGAMIAYAGFLLAKQDLCHDLRLESIPRGRIIPHDLQKRTH